MEQGSREGKQVIRWRDARPRIYTRSAVGRRASARSIASGSTHVEVGEGDRTPADNDVFRAHISVDQACPVELGKARAQVEGPAEQRLFQSRFPLVFHIERQGSGPITQRIAFNPPKQRGYLIPAPFSGHF